MAKKRDRLQRVLKQRASKMILQGEIDIKGVHVPVLECIYGPILKELEEVGITFIERKTEYSL